MTHEEFKGVLEEHILPMFTGASLSEEEESPAWKKRRAFLRNVCEMVIRGPADTGKCFVLRRSQACQQSDASFAEKFVEGLLNVHGISPSGFFSDLVNPILRQTVAETVARRASRVVSAVLRRFERWAEETYEGRRIAAAVGVDGLTWAQTGVSLLHVFGEPFGVVLANGLESFLVAGVNGDLLDYEPLSLGTDAMSLFAPLRFCPLAYWSKSGNTGLGLTRNGEILVLAERSPAFAKRRGAWRHFTHDALLKRISLHGSFAPDTCRAVYQTCLDVSFGRTGGGIALVKRTQLERLKSDNRVSPKDCQGAPGLKGQCLKAIVRKPFYVLDRRLRQDLVAMDGATILDYEGKLVAAGAIVNVDAGSEGGGRLAAARTLSGYGLAIKISSDGEIRGFKYGHSAPEEVFRVG